MTEELFGLYENQHRALERLDAASRHTTRPAVGVVSKPRLTVNGGARVMYVDEGYAFYNPREKRRVAVFHLNREADTKTIEMSGTDLNGNLLVTIAGVEYAAECRSTTEQLRAIFFEYERDCRITAFPGMWEFAWTGDAPEMSVRPGPLTGGSELVNGYTGGALLIDEAWVSSEDGSGGVEMIDVTDAMPFLEGQIRRGARAIAYWAKSDGWLVGEWACRAFSFRSEVR